MAIPLFAANCASFRYFERRSAINFDVLLRFGHPEGRTLQSWLLPMTLSKR
jgi:hypothetical protein